MVLEAFISPNKARKEPWELLFLSAAFVAFGVLVQTLIPEIRGSVVIFAMIPAIPLILHLLNDEEKKEEGEVNKDFEFWYTLFPEDKKRHYSFLGYHKSLIEIFAFFFIGATLSCAIIYALSPAGSSSQVFSDQLAEVNSINSSLNGHAVLENSTAYLLFTHNLQVLGLMFIFSLFYGMGSIYMLLWNASIIGVVVGAKIKAGGIIAGTLSLLSLFPHGFFEIGAYLIASIAGGMLSAMLARGSWRKPEGWFILKDVMLMAAFSVAILLIGAIIEGSY